MVRKFYTVLIIILTILISLSIQINFLNMIPLFGVVANLGIIVIVGFGLMNGKIIGGLTGALYGLLTDITFCKIIGINLFLYTIVGLITGQISSKFSKDNKTSMVMIVVVTTAIFELIHCILLNIITGSSISFFRMIIIISIEVAYNFLITAILHKFIVGLGEIINKSKSSYYLL